MGCFVGRGDDDRPRRDPFQKDLPYEPLESYQHRDNRTWTLWSHTWRPLAPGRYQIQLAVDDPAIRTRRLDRGYYARQIDIAEV